MLQSDTRCETFLVLRAVQYSSGIMWRAIKMSANRGRGGLCTHLIYGFAWLTETTVTELQRRSLEPNKQIKDKLDRVQDAKGQRTQNTTPSLKVETRWQKVLKHWQRGKKKEKEKWDNILQFTVEEQNHRTDLYSLILSNPNHRLPWHRLLLWFWAFSTMKQCRMYFVADVIQTEESPSYHWPTPAHDTIQIKCVKVSKFNSTESCLVHRNIWL